MKLYFNEMDCYKVIPEEKQTDKCFYYPHQFFDLDNLPTAGLQNEFAYFICERGRTLTFTSFYVDLRHYKIASSFLTECYPTLNTFIGLDAEKCISKMESYFRRNNIPLIRKSGIEHPAISYMRKAIEYFIPKDYIYFRDLPCYKDVPTELLTSARYQPDSYFDLARLPTTGTIRDEFIDFIHVRSEPLSFSSMEKERYCYQLFTDFIKTSYPSITSLTELDAEDIDHKLRRWFFKNKLPMNYIHRSRSTGGTSNNMHPLLGYVTALLNYFSDDDGLFHFEDDIWELSRLDILLRLPEITLIKTCNFSNIVLPEFKDMAKRIALVRFKEVTVRTAIAEIFALSKLAEFLAEYFPDVTSISQMDRELMEAYLTYLYTEDTRKKSYRGELMNLKSALHTAGKILEQKELSHLFLPMDFDRPSLPVFSFYTDTEVARWNKGFKTLPLQLGRVMIIHELLGLRISDTLTLESTCIYQKSNGAFFIHINQSKVNRSFEKPITPEIKTLLESAIAYTTSLYGTCRYIFVNDKDSTRPMQYGRLQYHLMCMIQDLDLRDDNGNLFTVGTHTFRHDYGKRLCDLDFDDATIAELLGHKGTASVKHYRKMGDKKLAQSTKDIRAKKDAKIDKYKEEW